MQAKKKVALAAVLALAGSMAFAAPTKVVWFVGLGTGASADQIPREQAVVDRYNKSQNEVELKMEVVENNTAPDNLAARLAAGNAPDFVGPVGGDGYNKFAGQWADLKPLIAKYKPNLKNMDDALLKFYENGDVTEGIPYAVYPSFIFVNKDAFDQAKLPYPPTKVGEKYQGKDWDWNTLADLAQKLTLDSAGNNATEKGFNAKKTTQFGFNMQWVTSMQHMGTMFGSGILYDAKTKKAQIPASWLDAWKWVHNGIWTKHFIPSNDAANSEAFGSGNTFNSGKIAMGYTHLWYQCCLDGGANAKVKRWTMAIIPSYKGKHTAALHADTFRMMKASKNKDAAFQAMMYLMNQKDLLTVYGAFPADEQLQDDFIAGVNRRYASNATINWQLVKDSLKIVDKPSHEAWVPNYTKSTDIANKYATKIFTNPKENIDRMARLYRIELQNAYRQAR